MWTNGVERFCYRRVDNDGVVTYDEIPDIPGKGRSEEEVERPRFDQLKAALSDALLFAFRRCHNYIAGNQGLQKPEAFWELLKVIFCKIHDERLSREVEFYATSKERDGLNGRLKAKKRLEKLFEDLKTEYPTIFRSNEAIELNPEVLAYIVSQLQMYSLLESDVDVKGRAYEEIVGSNLRGDRGEFFTPRNICQMAVAMLDPSEGDLILDPACGTAGFLITAMNHVIEKIRTAETERWGDIERAETAVRQRVHRFAQKYVVGLDLNPNLVKASKMNMVMNNDGTGGLFQANSLKAPVTWEDDLRGRRLPGTSGSTFHESTVRVEDTDRRPLNSRRLRSRPHLEVRQGVRFLDDDGAGAKQAATRDFVYRTVRTVPQTGYWAMCHRLARRNSGVTRPRIRTRMDSSAHPNSRQHRPAPRYVSTPRQCPNQHPGA